MLGKVVALALVALLVLGRVVAHEPQMRRRRLLLQAEVILFAVIFLAVFAVILVT